MNTSDHTPFLYHIASYVEKYPEIAAKISDYVRAGIERALAESCERAADMEVALRLQVLGPRKGVPLKPDVLAKLRKWKGKTALNWEEIG